MLLTPKIFKTAHKGFVLLSLKPNYHIHHRLESKIIVSIKCYGIIVIFCQPHFADGFTLRTTYIVSIRVKVVRIYIIQGINRAFKSYIFYNAYWWGVF